MSDDSDDEPPAASAHGDDRRVRKVMAAEPESQPLASRLARDAAKARVASKLFAKKAPTLPVKVGRHHVLNVVGSGGMGVVLGAWDPELERRVAIKLVRAVTDDARQRILAEGQSQAKVAHPNVVAVYDVGVIEDQVYLVMEWIQGENLRSFGLSPRSVPEVVDLYRQCAEGLAAAHRGGVIHRDFKPDNAIVGADKRVRVLDFGLATDQSGVPADGDAGTPAPVTESPDEDFETVTPPTRSTRPAGTRRYMAPEQRNAGVLTAAVDQYGLGVSLREALEGRGGAKADGPAAVPRWLEAIIARATAPKSQDRFASMEELAAALGRNPATVWRRRGLLATAALAVAGAFVIGTRRSSSVDLCGGGAGEVAVAWSASAGEELIRHVSTLGTLGAAEANRLRRDFDTYAQQWIVGHRAGCLAKNRGELTETLYERRLACQARSLAALQSAAAVIREARLETLSDAIIAARSLPDPECGVELNLGNVEPPPVAIAEKVRRVGADVEAARVRAIAAAADASERSAAARAAAHELGYGWLIARADFVDGLATATRDPATAAERYRAAERGALAAGDDDLATMAYARLIFRRDEMANETKDDLARFDIVAELAKRQTVSSYARALLRNYRGVAAMAAADAAAAERFFRAALVDAERVSPRAPELLWVLSNLALLGTGDQAELLSRAIADSTAVLGPNHPQVHTLRIHHATTLLSIDAAAEALAQACAALLADAPHAAFDVPCAVDTALLAILRGDEATARRWLEIGSRDIEAGELARQLKSTPRDPLATVRYTEEFLADPDRWWRLWRGAVALRYASVRLARAHQLQLAERALTLTESAVKHQSQPMTLRARAYAAAQLARLLGPNARGEKLAIMASQWLAEAGGTTDLAEASTLQALVKQEDEMSPKTVKTD